MYRILAGGTVRQRVCQSCAALAVPVLASDAPARCEHCKSALARFCGGCIAHVITKTTGVDLVRELARSSTKGRGTDGT